jgi:hypothetical protein
LVLHAPNDPFIRYTPETLDAVRANRHITFVENVPGGHCAYLSQALGSADDDGRWAEITLLRYLQSLDPMLFSNSDGR